MRSSFLRPNKRWLALSVGLLACGGAASEPAEAGRSSKPAASTAGPAHASVKVEPPALPPCTPDKRAELPSGSLAFRQKGVDALAMGRISEAADVFREALTTRPRDLAAFTFRTAAEAERNALREQLGKATERLKAVEAATASPPNKTLARADKLPKAGVVALKRLSDERHDHDTYAFLKRAGIHSTFVEPKGAEGKATFPDQFADLAAGGRHHHEDHTIVSYGPAVLMLGDPSGGLRAVSLLAPLTEGFQSVLKPAVPPPPPPSPTSSPASIPPPPIIDPTSIHAEVRFAKVVGSILVAQLSHEGDGLGAKPDGFLVGFDLATDKLAWVSDARVSNGYSFYTSGAYAVGAYGTTTPEERARARNAYTKPPAGDAKLVVVELATGKTVATAPLQGRADYVFGKGDRVFAWGEDTIETFEISASPPAPKTDLGALTKFGSGVTSLPTGAATKCWLTNAAIALDHRDGPALLAIAPALPQDASLTKGLVAAGEFFVERAGGRPGLDLTEVEPIALKPLATAKVRTDGPRKTVPTKRFTPIKETELFYPSGRPVELKKGEKRAEFAQNAHPSGPTHLFPREYGIASLYWAFRDGESAVLAYGLRYVALVKDDAVAKVLDFGPFGGPADANAPQDPLAFFTFIDGALLVVTTYGGYDPKSSRAFLASVDPASGSTLWRTEPGVLARPPVIFEDFIATVVNRGGSSELVAFRRHDGQVATKVTFPDAATDFGWDGRGALFITLPKERKYFTFR